MKTEKKMLKKNQKNKSVQNSSMTIKSTIDNRLGLILAIFFIDFDSLTLNKEHLFDWKWRQEFQEKNAHFFEEQNKCINSSKFDKISHIY